MLQKVRGGEGGTRQTGNVGWVACNRKAKKGNCCQTCTVHQACCLPHLHSFQVEVGKPGPTQYMVTKRKRERVHQFKHFKAKKKKPNDPQRGTFATCNGNLLEGHGALHELCLEAVDALAPSPLSCMQRALLHNAPEVSFFVVARTCWWSPLNVCIVTHCFSSSSSSNMYTWTGLS